MNEQKNDLQEQANNLQQQQQALDLQKNIAEQFDAFNTQNSEKMKELENQVNDKIKDIGSSSSSSSSEQKN